MATFVLPEIVAREFLVTDEMGCQVFVGFSVLPFSPASEATTLFRFSLFLNFKGSL